MTNTGPKTVFDGDQAEGMTVRAAVQAAGQAAEHKAGGKLLRRAVGA